MNGPEASSCRENSFDIIRLFAAACVLLSHQVGMAGLPEPALGPLAISLSSVGLYIFFALSGYLVFQSLKRDPRPGRFIAARVLRIYPAFLVNLAFCVVLGALITTATQQQFWTSTKTWAYIYYNAPILTVPTQFQLPGVLENARWPVVNGSIWTIKYEILCYIALLALSIFVQSQDRWCHSLRVCFLVIAPAYIAYISMHSNPSPQVFFSEYNAFNLLRFAMTFCAGAIYAANEPLGERTRLLFLSVPASLIIFGPSPHFGRAGIILLLTLFVIEIGRSRIFYSEWYRSIGDLSYGVFLYGYPVQNLFMTQFHDGTYIRLILLTAATVIVVVGCAYASWRWVERPILQFKPRSTHQRREDRHR